MTAPSNSKEPELAPLGNQVAGHPDGVQSLEGGRLVVKDCLARELGFYREVKLAARGEASLDPGQVELLKRLNEMMPECHGSWEDYTGFEAKGSTDTPRIVLENLTFGYEKPNVCDIKLGTQLWDEDASEEKKQRMEKAAASTTSGSHGIRLTGWQTYDADTRAYHSIPKTFGKTIMAKDLELGMRMLLACPEEGDAQRAEEAAAGSSICKDSSGYRLPSLPEELVMKLLRDHLIKDVEELHAIFSKAEVRMRGASLLIVYEGEASQLEQSLCASYDGSRKAKPQVRLIDFGHATIVAGKGRDEGVLLGLATVLDLAKRTLDRLEYKQRHS